MINKVFQSKSNFHGIRKILLKTGVIIVLVYNSITNLAGANSLWLAGEDLYSSRSSKTFRVGDIITIKINEQATAKHQASTDTTDNTQLEVKSSPKIPVFKKVFDKFLGKNEVKNRWQGNGTTTRSGTLAGTISAKVIEILPNGNLVIEGKRSLRVNKETQIIIVKGIVRPQDVDSSNSIDSKFIAEAEIFYEGKGAIGRTQKPGIFTQIANWLF